MRSRWSWQNSSESCLRGICCEHVFGWLARYEQAQVFLLKAVTSFASYLVVCINDWINVLKTREKPTTSHVFEKTCEHCVHKRGLCITQSNDGSRQSGDTTSWTGWGPQMTLLPHPHQFPKPQALGHQSPCPLVGWQPQPYHYLAKMVGEGLPCNRCSAGGVVASSTPLMPRMEVPTSLLKLSRRITWLEVCEWYACFSTEIKDLASIWKRPVNPCVHCCFAETLAPGDSHPILQMLNGGLHVSYAPLQWAVHESQSFQICQRQQVPEYGDCCNDTSRNLACSIMRLLLPRADRSSGDGSILVPK